MYPPPYDTYKDLDVPIPFIAEETPPDKWRQK
jgi:hypothetical protein